MVTETAPDTVAAEPQTTSEVGTPPSEATPEVVSQETATPASTGEETPSTGEEAKPEARAPESYTREELDDIYRKGKLADPTLVERRERLIQSERDQKAHEDNVIAERNRLERETLQYMTRANATLEAGLKAIDDMFAEHGGPPALQQQQRNQLMAQHQASIAGAVETFHKAGHRDAIMRLEGETSLKRRQELDAMPLPELAKVLYSASYDAGRKAGVPEGHIAKTVADWEKEKANAVQEALDAYKAANPGQGLPSTANSGSSAAGVESIAAWQARPMADRERKRREDPNYETRVYGITG